jgi:aryl-alcohol dehydrogenase-like predicted oxidoreductase
MIELGLGLLSIGRPWGHRREAPPPERDAFALLEKAAALGIRFFDTAPAYGTSEAILGRFLRESGAHAVVSTKMGEWWDPESGTSTVDHSYDALAGSIDRSLERLGRIDILQLHKATAACLATRDVSRAVEYARQCGIREFGASVSDLAAAQAASQTGWCSYLQFPFNQANTALAPIFQLGLKSILNRPLAMGAIHASAEAFAFIRRQSFEGVVLTGTKSIRHLVDNHAAFYVTSLPDS